MRCFYQMLFAAGLLVSAALAQSLPAKMSQCEANRCDGTWTFKGHDGEAIWRDGSRGHLKIAHIDAGSIDVERHDTEGLRVGMAATYHGTMTGNHYEGKYTWKWTQYPERGEHVGNWSADVTEYASPSGASATSQESLESVPGTVSTVVKPRAGQTMCANGLAMDSAANLYISDCGAIRKLDPRTGIIATVAGNSAVRGYAGDGGPATSALFFYPTAITLDAEGNLYIADSRNRVIRKVAATTGIITTFAGHHDAGPGGNPSEGRQAPAIEWRLDEPTGLASDTAGNIYIAENFDNKILKVAPGTGITTTVARMISWVAKPVSPIVLDSGGNLYFAIPDSDFVQKLSLGTGASTRIAGSLFNLDQPRSVFEGFSGDGGLALSAKMAYPGGLALDAAGNLYVADLHNYRIRMIAAGTGVITPVAGNGTEASAVLNYKEGGPASGAPVTTSVIASDPSGNLYLGERDGSVIKITRH